MDFLSQCWSQREDSSREYRRRFVTLTDSCKHVPIPRSPSSGRQGAARRAAGGIRDDGVDVVVRGIGVGSDCVAPRGAVAHSGQLGDVGGRVARRGENKGDGVVVKREEVVGLGVIEDWGQGRRRGKKDYTSRRWKGKRRKTKLETGNGWKCLREPHGQ